MLLLALLLLGVLPQALRQVANFQNLGFAIAVFLANLFVCRLGIATGRFLAFWIAYALVCVLTFVLFGMTGPIGTLLILPVLAF